MQRRPVVSWAALFLCADPAHTMLAVSDEDGNSQGHLWYDPHGSVLSSTLPVTLTDASLPERGLMVQ